MERALEVSRTLLHEAGLRATAQRIAVLGVLHHAREHLSVEAVTDRAQSRLGSVSKQAVYGVLDALASKGLARRIEPAGSPALFEARVGDNHHHAVCRRCGAIADVDCVAGTAPCLKAPDAHGFLLDEAEITFWGLCPGCQTAARIAEAEGAIEP